MRRVLLSRFLPAAALLAACHADPPAATQQAAPPAPLSPTATLASLRGVWQLDYYPDSLLTNRDIYENSNWTAPYAANLRFAGDSCEFTGWHEGWAVKPHPTSPNLYLAGDSLQSWQFRQLSPNKLLFREFNPTADTSVTWYPYHRVARVLTQAALKTQVARQLFAGRYQVLQADRPASPIVTLGADWRVTGLPGVARYDVVTDMDWDFLLPNAFNWQSARGKELAQYSFEFAGDTLLLHSFEVHPEDEAVPSGVLVTEPVVKLLKLPAH